MSHKTLIDLNFSSMPVCNSRRFSRRPKGLFFSPLLARAGWFVFAMSFETGGAVQFLCPLFETGDCNFCTGSARLGTERLDFSLRLHQD